jgi:hypothetical protein
MLLYLIEKLESMLFINHILTLTILIREENIRTVTVSSVEYLGMLSGLYRPRREIIKDSIYIAFIRNKLADTCYIVSKQQQQQQQQQQQ